MDEILLQAKLEETARERDAWRDRFESARARIAAAEQERDQLKERVAELEEALDNDGDWVPNEEYRVAVKACELAEAERDEALRTNADWYKTYKTLSDQVFEARDLMRKVYDYWLNGPPDALTILFDEIEENHPWILQGTPNGTVLWPKKTDNE